MRREHLRRLRRPMAATGLSHLDDVLFVTLALGQRYRSNEFHIRHTRILRAERQRQRHCLDIRVRPSGVESMAVGF